MNSPRAKGRIAAIVILCAIVLGSLGAGEQRPLPPHSRPRWTPTGATLRAQPLDSASVSEPATSPPPITSGVWTPLNSQPFTQNFFPGSIYLLTDGRVLAENDNFTALNWWTLTPDNTGSYINGTWNQVA